MSFSTDDLTVVFVAVTESVPVADLTDDNVGVMIAVKTTALALENLWTLVRHDDVDWARIASTKNHLH
ncbi:hypothetical protein BG005_009590 [Podila minutissima]|nr:hypothetical protein BG005_009590 [Podila minutissima]